MTPPEIRVAVRYSIRDVDVMARTLYGEIRGGDWDAMVAVAWAIRNRVDIDLGNDGKPDWWGEGVAGVCLAPDQFSCWSSGDVNRPKLMAVSTDNAAFRQCLAVTAAVLGDLVPSPIGEATHYFAPLAVKRDPPWTRKTKDGRQARPVGRVGPHLFYAAVP